MKYIYIKKKNDASLMDSLICLNKMPLLTNTGVKGNIRTAVTANRNEDSNTESSGHK